ncbi:MAG: endonuclease/exonuclease/phosphatase family protein [Chloroflexi bacterium]|nr:endonuclease/exonuclease/phosphatase family protein [Chloroflexota bacterium]
MIKFLRTFTAYAFWICALFLLGVEILPVRAAHRFIANDAADRTPIYAIQGAGLVSPQWQQWVDTAGIVSGVGETGFYLQDPVGDHDPATSDGIFVYTRTRPSVQPGQCIYVQHGYVDEFYEKTELSRAKAILPVDDCVTTVLAPVLIPSPRLGRPPVELFERYEGMLVQMENLAGIVQGPTERFSNNNVEIALLPEALAPYVEAGRVYQVNADDTSALTFLSNNIGATLPDVVWGDRIVVGALANARIATGVLDYNFGQYRLNLLPNQRVMAEAHSFAPTQGVASTPHDFTVCTFNLYGLGRGSEQLTQDAEYQAQLHKQARVISESLHGCTILGLQETGRPEDAQNLARELQTSFGLSYTVTALAGPQTSNPEFPLTLSLLTRRDRVEVLKAAAPQACTSQNYQVNVLPGVCPAGEFALFDRPPLMATLRVTGDWGEPYLLQIIDNHWKSKGGDETVNVVRREKQARFVAALVQAQLDSDPTAHIIVLGDLNDYYASVPVMALRTAVQPALLHTYDFLQPLARYTYIYNGASQILDHILMTPNMAPILASVQPIHMNADFPAPAIMNAANVERASDHDPVQIRLRPTGVGIVGGNVRYADTTVQLVDGAAQVVAEAQTDALGDFRLWNLTPAAYTLRLLAPAYLLPAQPALDLVVKPGYHSIGDQAMRHRTIDIVAATALFGAQLADQLKP